MRSAEADLDRVIDDAVCGGGLLRDDADSTLEDVALAVHRGEGTPRR